MRRILSSKTRLVEILTTVFLMGIALSRVAYAQYGVNLAWDDCPGSGNETNDKTVACTDAGAFNLLFSFGSPMDIPDLGAVEWYLDIHVDEPTISAWWSQPTRFGTDLENQSGASCGRELWNLSPHPPIALGPAITQIAPNRLRFRGGWVFVAGEEQPVQAQTEYYSHTLQLRFTGGTTDDPGCVTPACMLLGRVDLWSPGLGNAVELSTPLVQQMVSWQGGNYCLSVVATKQSSWGQLKALYR